MLYKMAEEIDIKEEPVWLEETDPYVSNTVVDDHGVKIEPPTSILRKVENDTLEDDMAMPPADVKHEIFVEELRVPCFKEEDNSEDGELATSGSVQSMGDCCKTRIKCQSLTVKKQYSCKICNRVFFRRGNLENHEFAHTGQQSYRCYICHVEFPAVSDFQQHMLTHSGDRPFNCHLCSGAFMNKRSLNQHMITHSQERPHCCDLCNKTFSRKATLRRHTLLHNERRPYTCETCKAWFSSQRYLSKHLLVHSREHYCDICKRSFTSEAILKGHLTTHSRKHLHFATPSNI